MATSTKKPAPLKIPKGLPKDGNELYKTIHAYLDEIGLWHVADESALYNFVALQIQIDRALQQLMNESILIDTVQGVKANPVVASINSLSSAQTKYAQMLGIGGANRKRLQIELKKAGIAPANPWAKAV